MALTDNPMRLTITGNTTVSAELKSTASPSGWKLIFNSSGPHTQVVSDVFTCPETVSEITIKIKANTSDEISYTLPIRDDYYLFACSITVDFGEHSTLIAVTERRNLTQYGNIVFQQDFKNDGYGDYAYVEITY